MKADDITNQDVKLQIEKLSGLQQLLIDIAALIFENPVDKDLTILTVLKKVGTFVKADRAYLFTYDYDRKTATNTHEWCSEGIEPQIDKLKEVPFEVMGYWPEKHAASEMIIIPDMDLEEDEYVREALSEQGIRSLISIPYFLENKCAGFVGLDSVDKMQVYDQNVIYILRVFAQQMSVFRARQEYDSILSHNEARYRLTQEVGGIGSWEYCDRTKTYWNSVQLRKLFGVDHLNISDSQEINNQIISTIVDYIPVEQALELLINDHKPYDIEFEIIRKNDGERRFLHSRAVLVESPDCNDKLVRGVITDITERKLALDKIRESEKNYQNLYHLLRRMADTMPDMIWAKNLNKEYVFANKAICDNLLSAVDTQEPIGKTDMFFALRERNRFSDNSQWHTFGEMCSDSDTITLQEMKQMQFDEFGNVQGKFLYLDVHKAPLYDADGKLIGVVGSARDITMRMAYENELKQYNADLNKILETTFQFNKPKSSDVDYSQVTNALRELSGAGYVALNIFYENYFQTVSISGIPDVAGIINEYLGFNPYERKWKRNPRLEDEWLSSRFVNYKSLLTVVDDVDPKLLIEIEKLFEIGEIFSMPVYDNDRLVANLLFLSIGEQKIRNNSLIELFAFQLGQFIVRSEAERTLLKKVADMERFHWLTINRELNMIDLKKEVNELLRLLGRDQKYNIVQ